MQTLLSYAGERTDQAKQQRRRRAMSCAMTLSLLAGCASQAALDNLAMAQQQHQAILAQCQAGNGAACDAIPASAANLAQAQQQAEASQQENAAITGAILIPLIAVGTAAALTPHGGHGGGPGGGPGPHRGPPPR